MRTAAICPTCATYENDLCILYNGAYLPNTDIQPLDSVEVALQKIDAAFESSNGVVAPTTAAVYIGQLYVDTAAPALYYAKSTGLGAADWVKLANF